MNDQNQPGEQLSPLKLAFLKLQEAEERIRQLEAAQTAPIAIVGIGCRIPGAEAGPDSYWRMLRDRRCAISDGMHRRLRATVGAVQLPDSARRAALLSQIDMFDPQQFGISPREAASMDPQQRLLLEVSWEALEHAGIDPGSLYQTNTGVYIGIASHDYAQLQMRDGNLQNLDLHFAAGAASSIAAGRIAYTLGLNGPAISVDTACSSSLVAVHLARESLLRRECSMALAGGVNVILAPEASVSFAQAGMLSSCGISSPFLSSADGFVRGEGCGIVVLKRLADAEAAGDRILAVILGSAVNQDGASSGLTAPNGLAQQALLREACRRSGIAPSEIGYIEAHGTGTKLGDPIEAEALGAVFAGRSDKLPIGSVKGNIGHLEAAAGIAGLIKLVLSIEHGEIPGQVLSNGLSEHIRWDKLPLELSKETCAWRPIAGRRIGGVSSFGFSGTNAHVVVEGWPREQRACAVSEGPDVLALSAGTEAALRALAGKYVIFLKETGWDWSEICHTAGAGRAAMAERLAIAANGKEDAAEKLSTWLNGDASTRVYRGQLRGLHRADPGPADDSSPEIVAKRFVLGDHVDWNRHRAGVKLQRADLPTYPFQRERYWFEERDLEGDTADKTVTIPHGLTESSSPPQDLRLILANASAKQRLEIIRNFLRDEVAQVLEMNTFAEPEEEKSLTELGMDSIMAVELKHRVQQSSGVTLPANFLFEYPTIRRAATYLNAMIGSNESESHSQTSPAGYEDIAL